MQMRHALLEKEKSTLKEEKEILSRQPRQPRFPFLPVPCGMMLWDI